MKRVRIPWDTIPRTTAYEVQYREVGSQNWGPILTVTTNYIDVVLEIGKSYQFRVRSVCGSERSAWAYLGVNVYTNSGVCFTPSGIAVERLPDSLDFRISWDNNSDAQSWNLRYRRQGDLAWTTTTATVPYIILSGLVVGATYEYEIQTVCSVGTVSNWSNTGTFTVSSSASNQRCPITYEEEFTGSLTGRKSNSDVVTISGTIAYTSGEPLPEVEDFIIIGNVGFCCSPVNDVTIPVDAPGFTGELTITAAGQMSLYIATYKASPSLDFSLTNLSYQGFAGECPPEDGGGGGVGQLTGGFTLTCTDHGCSQQGAPVIQISFPAPTPAPVTLLLGFTEQLFNGLRYFGADIFTPPPGAQPGPLDGQSPFIINIPAGVTTFTSSGRIYMKNHGNDSGYSWTCHSCQRPIVNLYVKVESPGTLAANFTWASGGQYGNITLNNV